MPTLKILDFITLTCFIRISVADGEEKQNMASENKWLPQWWHFLFTREQLGLSMQVCCYLIGTKGNIACLDFFEFKDLDTERCKLVNILQI